MLFTNNRAGRQEENRSHFPLPVNQRGDPPHDQGPKLATEFVQMANPVAMPAESPFALKTFNKKNKALSNAIRKPAVLAYVVRSAP